MTYNALKKFKITYPMNWGTIVVTAMWNSLSLSIEQPQCTHIIMVSTTVAKGVPTLPTA